MSSPSPAPGGARPAAAWARYLPGLALSAALAGLGWLIQVAEQQIIGQAVIEALVVAILLGAIVRTFWVPGRRWTPGIRVSGKQVLELAIVLLGASVSLPVLLQAGPVLVAAIVLVVATGLAASTALGRLLGLNPRLAVLVACGNSICGNSAIAAVAPVIGATADDVAAAIALTAVVGVVMVLVLPLLIPLLHFSFYQYGVLAGMTVYAVPQVLAATIPVSLLSGQVGTLVKLVRVLLLGPVVVIFAVRFRGAGREGRLGLGSLVPWFIVGFLLLAALRSLGVLPADLADGMRTVAVALTVVAMAALGLGVDVRAVSRVGRPIALAVIGSLLVLIALSVTLIRVLGIG